MNVKNVEKIYMKSAIMNITLGVTKLSNLYKYINTILLNKFQNNIQLLIMMIPIVSYLNSILNFFH